MSFGRVRLEREVSLQYRFLTGLGLVFALAGNWGCAIPGGSYARPVDPLEKKTNVIGGGMMVPFAGAGAATESAEGTDASFATFGDAVVFAPGFSFDRAFADGSTWGIETSVFSTALSTQSSPADSTIIKINPRFEFALGKNKLERNLSFTLDGNLGIWTGQDFTVPIFSPTIGLRYYLRTGYGGLVLAQNLGTAFITVSMPGSVSYDLPIGDRFHVFPEFRWDPTFFFASLGDTVAGVAVFFSGGMSFMVEF